MYQPAHFAPPDRDAVIALMRERPLATLVAATSQGLSANLVPLEFDASAGPHGSLRGHVARANPLWREASAGHDVLALFHGPQAYVSPGWYPSKQVHGKVVPTWNYAVVEARGPLRVIEDRVWLRALVGRLTEHHEASQTSPWRMDEAPADFIEQMLGAIVGIEITLTALSGKWKLGQNRSAADRAGTQAGLEACAEPDAAAVAAWMRGLG